MWRCTGQGVGAQCVMISGVALMLQWYADSWDTTLLVSYALIVNTSNSGVRERRPIQIREGIASPLLNFDFTCT